LAFLYIGMSTGATLHFHYCMGKLVSWGLVDREGEHCAICGMLKSTGHGQGIAKKNCCKDEHKLIQSTKDQKVTSSDDLFLKHAPALPAAMDGSLPIVALSCTAVTNPCANAPPGWGQVPLFLLNRNFRV
jgi:hypothetical protein